MRVSESERARARLITLINPCRDIPVLQQPKWAEQRRERPIDQITTAKTSLSMRVENTYTHIITADNQMTCEVLIGNWLTMLRG